MPSLTLGAEVIFAMAFLTVSRQASGSLVGVKRAPVSQIKEEKEDVESGVLNEEK
jgi:hypothetical protein